MYSSPATMKWDATNISRLKTHIIKNGQALCNKKLQPLYGDSGRGIEYEVDCNKCKRMATA